MPGLRRATWLPAATMTLVLAACSGGGGGAQTAPPAAAASEAAGTPELAASPAAAASAESAAGGASGAGVCDLVTPDELAAAFAVASVSTSVIPGPPDTCVVQSDTGDALASWSHTTSGAGTTYGAVVMPGQSTEVSGIGDKAAFVDNMGFLVLKGDSMVVITIASGADLDEAASQDVSKQLGALVAGRM